MTATMSAAAGDNATSFTDCIFFYEDEVFRVLPGPRPIATRLQMGMVIENAEYASSDDEDAGEAGEERGRTQPQPQNGQNANNVGGKPPRQRTESEVTEHGSEEAGAAEKLRPGHVRVAWFPKGNEEVVSQEKLFLSDRSLMPGDVVRKNPMSRNSPASGRASHRKGYCRAVRVRSSVRVVGTDRVIANVDSKDLKPVEEFSPDVVVSLDSWVGMIRTVKAIVTLSFEDGSVCTLPDLVAETELSDTRQDRPEESQFKRYDFYPGQVLRGPISIFAKKATFSNCTDELRRSLDRARLPGPASRHKSVRVTVVKTTIKSLQVEWQCQAGGSNSPTIDSRLVQPSATVQGDDLKRVRMLNVFEHCTLQIGDLSFYTLKEEDLVQSYDSWATSELEYLLKNTDGSAMCATGATAAAAALPESPRTKRKSRSKTTSQSSQKNNQDIVNRAASKGNEDEERDSEYEDIDSSEEEDSDDEDDDDDDVSVGSASGRRRSRKRGMSRRSRGMSTKGAPKRRQKKAKRSSAGPAHSRELKAGDRLVVETISTRSDADVLWQDGQVEADVASRDLFPIQHLDEQEYFCGDFVVRNSNSSFDQHRYGVVQDVDYAERVCKVKWFKTYTTGNEPCPEVLETTDEPVYDLRDHPDFRFRPGSIVIRVANFDSVSSCNSGQVFDNDPSGRVNVWWADGTTSMCWPQDLYKLGEYDSDNEDGLWNDEDDDFDDNDDSYGDDFDDSLSSDDSWETQSEHSAAGDEAPAPSAPDLRASVAASMERIRVNITELEEVFRQHSPLAAAAAGALSPGAMAAAIQSPPPPGAPPSAATTAHVLRMLVEVYRECRTLDRLMGTSFFDESHFLVLLEGLTNRVEGRHHAVQDQINRLFTNNATDGTQQQQQDSSATGASGSAPPGADSTQDPAVRMFRIDANNYMEVCAQLLPIWKSQLLQVHEEVTRRFGGPGAALAREDLLVSPEEAGAQDLADIMRGIFRFTTGSLQRRFADLSSLLLPALPAEAENENEPEEEPATPTETEAKGVTTQEIASALHGGLVGSAVKKDVGATASVSSEADVEGAAALAESVPGVFSILESSHSGHKFKLSLFTPAEPKNFIKFVRKEIHLLKTSLPPGITVKAFEDRMDLYSVMIKGPEKTPYQDGLFFFDFQLAADYPKSPPKGHYLSYCTDRLNPNLYEDGKVCVSLLGTWSGKGTETWSPNSNMLQLLVSIQGLILNDEPYYNEAGYERHRDTTEGRENSRVYNEMVLLKMVQAMTRLVNSPPEVFADEVRAHFAQNAKRLFQRLERWRQLSLNKEQAIPDGAGAVSTQSEGDSPDFPLLPASRGFCISLAKAMSAFDEALVASGIVPKSIL